MAAPGSEPGAYVLSSLARTLLAGLAIVLAAGCSNVVHELKAARNARGEALHERLSQVIHDNGFTHGIRSVREDQREIDTVFVSIPLDSLKRRHISLHHMLFAAARLCARPEYAAVSIRIELNAADESDREYMRGIVGPIVADARNVSLFAQREAENDFVITMSHAPGAAAKGANSAK